MSVLNIISDIVVSDGTKYIVIPGVIVGAGIAFLIGRATNR